MSLPALYNQKFIDAVKNTNQPFLDTQNYGITLTPVADPSQPHWRIIGIHHLTGPENQGQHNLFCDVLNEQGQRMPLSKLTLRNNDQPPATLTLDKPANEAGTNASMFFNDTLSISVNRDGLPSETAGGFSTRHGDDDFPGTTRGHHSFYIVFQKSAGGTGQPAGPTGGGVGEQPPVNGSSLESELWAAGQPLIQPFNREAALYKKAQEQGLGEHLTREYELMHDGRTYIAQIFEVGMAYAPAGQWDQVKVVDTATRDVAETGPALFWDNHITGFLGNRSQYWEWYLKGNVPGLEWAHFKDEVINQNPILPDDGWVFKADKIYRMPRVEGQSAAPASAPLITPALPPAAAQAPVAGAAVAANVPRSRFVQARNGRFQLNGKPNRFIGANIRGLVHYGHIPLFPGDPNTLRRAQLQEAKNMNARLVRVFLPHKTATPQEVAARLQETINLLKAEFPDVYLLPALTDLYIDAEFIVKGDDHFYESPTPNAKQILNHAFFSDGYKDNYEKFVKLIVESFKEEPQIFAWEICNEVKAENAPELLVNFMTTMARQIKTWDSNHMVTTGMISTRHAFMSKDSPLRDKLYGSPHIDFVTIHAYNGNENPHNENPPPIEDDSDLARKFTKPFIIEEAGFNINLPQYRDRRPEKTREDMAHWVRDGANCYMPWGFVAPGPDNRDGDRDVGMSAPLQGDYRELFKLHQRCGEILLSTDIDKDVTQAIATIDFSVAKEVLPTLPWPIIVDGFDFPVGKPDGLGYFVAAGLVDPQYHAERGFWHTGEDWNGIKGGDSDLGDPVFATAHGLVITAQPFDVWGNIVLLEHVMPTGQKVWSQYAHLKNMLVKKGDILRRGEVVGTIGKGGNDRFLAHLHFEIRLRNLPASKAGWKTPEDRETVLRSYAHPTNFIKSFRSR
jgi:hypothetical protein